MLTPQELRNRGLSYIKTARELLKAGQWDNASYIVGYAVELSLKARFCTRNGLSHFPADHAQAAAIGKGKLFIHDLEKLLTLADGESIKKQSMLSIDWDRAMDWSEQKRYEAVGSVSEGQATTQVNETAKLCFELALFEIVEKMRDLEVSLSSEIGPFSLFLVGDRVSQNEGWEVLMSAWWLDTEPKLQDIVNRGQAMLDDDLFAMITHWSGCPPGSKVVSDFNFAAQCVGGYHEHSLRLITRGNYVDGQMLPPAFIITNCPRPKPNDVNQ